MGKTMRTTSKTDENPDLLALGKRLRSVAEEYQAEKDKCAAIVAEWSSRWPLAPDELTYETHGDWDCRELTIDGDFLVRPGDTEPLRVQKAEWIAHSIDYAEFLLRGKTFERQNKVRRLTREQWEARLAEEYEVLPIAREYERHREQVRELSGIDDSNRRLRELSAVLTTVMKRILSEPEYTLEGVRIKAEAIALAGSLDRFQVVMTIEGEDWGVKLARCVLRHVGA
ncbi:hypothetical protein [Rhizobium sp. BK251]|uniref:hypothetical protein n=1 Tax=Rhizobium sp. BK251 TaxID=2512125 RepID=UPI00104CBE89|nr:hypothetical protein [Rhizobium sp. BK251]TCL70512.1 hypothetical protein EV286_107387 [Rhizobium sp. BK251]